MKKWLRYLLVTILVLSCLSLCGCSFSQNEKFYKEAEKLFKEGKYMEAEQKYFYLHTVAKYKDSEAKHKMCYYEYGKQLIAEEDWTAAQIQFEKISNYKDSQDYISMCEANLAYEYLFSGLKEYELVMSDLELTSYGKVSLGGSKYGELFSTGVHFTSEEFIAFTDNDKLTVFEVIAKNMSLLTSECSITSGDAVYGYANRGTENVLLKDGIEILTRKSIDSPTYKTFLKGEKCPFCNGTGSVRYYYGSSNLEAILSGHDPYTVGECSSCKGKGKFYETVTREDVPKTDAQKIKEGTYETKE